MVNQEETGRKSQGDRRTEEIQVQEMRQGKISGRRRRRGWRVRKRFNRRRNKRQWRWRSRWRLRSRRRNRERWNSRIRHKKRSRKWMEKDLEEADVQGKEVMEKHKMIIEQEGQENVQ